MNKDILSLGKSLKRGLGNRVVSTALAGAMVFSLMDGIEAESYSLEAPKLSYGDFKNYDGIKIFINGRYVEFNDDMGYPTLINGVTYIPVRVVSETFNANVSYYQEYGFIYISKHGQRLRIIVGSDNLDVVSDLESPLSSNYDLKMNAKAFIQNGRTYIPLRAIFEAFGADVKWDQSTMTAIVTDNYIDNSKYIDFKDYKTFGIKDIDLSKNYKSIIYDGVSVDKEYVKLLQNANEYKVMEDGGVLYIYSYQYLFDLNYLYKAHYERKYNLSDDESFYSMWSISPSDYEFVTDLTFIDGYVGQINSTAVDMDEVGYVYNLRSAGNKEHYNYIDSIVDPLVNSIKASASDESEMVRLVNAWMCDNIKALDTTDKDRPQMFRSASVYNTLYYKEANCAGYSETFKYIMDKLGIPCVIGTGLVKGTTVMHGWNEVYIDGKWKVVDVQGNDKRADYEYFLLIDLESSKWNGLIEVSSSRKNEMDTVKRTLKVMEEN